MRLMRQIEIEGKKIVEIEIRRLTYRHFRLLEKKELHKDGEVKYKVIAELIENMTAEDGSVIEDRAYIQTFVNKVDLFTANMIPIESKKFEIEPEKDEDDNLKIYYSQMHKCPKCEKMLSLPFDVTEPTEIKDIEDLEIIDKVKDKKYMVKFRLPNRIAEKKLLKQLNDNENNDDYIDGFLRMFIASVNDSQNYEKIPFIVIKKIMEYVKVENQMGYTKDYEFECHNCNNEMKIGLDVNIESFFE